MKYFITFTISTVALLFVAMPALADEDKTPAFIKCEEAYLGQQIEAYELCLPLAEEERNTQARKWIADMYYWGWGDAVPRNQRKAFIWYKRAAAKGNVEAKFNLGVLYEQGIGTDADFENAFRWYLSAAKDGHVNAQFNLANFYSKGAGIKAPDQFQAAFWYLSAARKGQPESMYNMGNRYARGRGVSADPAESYKWYRLAERYGLEIDSDSVNAVKGELSEGRISQIEKDIQLWKAVP